MKRLIGLINQHLAVGTFNEEKMPVAETRDLSRMLAIALMALAAAACAHPRFYHTLTNEPVPRDGALVRPVAIGIDGPIVRWRCTYEVAAAGQEFTVEQSAPFCDYHRAIP